MSVLLSYSAMEKRRSPEKASDREKKWDKIFNAIVKMCQNQQNDRLILEETIKHLNGVIYKLKVEQKVKSLKAEVLLGMKERESAVFKHRHAEDDINDFRKWCDNLVKKCSGPTDISIDISNKGEISRQKALKDEVRKLKSEIQRYKLEKDSEISALLTEKNFVWNQYKEMETSFNEQLRKKRDEVDNANEKVQILASRADELHILNEKLRANITKMESESSQKNEEIPELLKEIESLKSRSGSASMILRPCKADVASSSRCGKNSSTPSENIAKVKKESDLSQTTEKSTHTRPIAHKSTGGKAPKNQLGTKGSSSSSKRKPVDVIIIPDTLRLFTSSFKVPKLKNSETT